jgi:hypothetical protein
MTRGEVVGYDWVIPAARMKNKREHVIPLSASKAADALCPPLQAIRTLKRSPDTATSETFAGSGCTLRWLLATKLSFLHQR